MKMKLLYCASLIWFLAGCHSENPFIPKEQADALLKKDEVLPVQYVAAIVDDQVYWIRNFDRDPKKLNGLPTGTKSHIRVSHKHSKLAFILNNENIVTTDTLGGSSVVTPTFGGIKQYDWSHDDKTLWALVDNDVVFFGPTLDIPELEREPEEQILSVAITEQNDVVYIVEKGLGAGQLTERLEFRSHDGSWRTITKKEGEIRHMSTVRLSKDGKHYILGYTTANSYDYLAKIEIYPVGEYTPEYTDETNFFFDPVYDSKSSYIVTARSDSDFDEYYLVAQYTLNDVLGPDNNKYKYNYKAPIGKIYVDWK